LKYFYLWGTIPFLIAFLFAAQGSGHSLQPLKAVPLFFSFISLEKMAYLCNNSRNILVPEV